MSSGNYLELPGEAERPTIAQIKAFLDQPYWPDGVKCDERYFRTTDDNDGELHYGLSLTFSEDGDAWLNATHPPMESCRFRTLIGGGRSLRVRAALLILALAIDMDNQENPILPNPQGGDK